MICLPMLEVFFFLGFFWIPILTMVVFDIFEGNISTMHEVAFVHPQENTASFPLFIKPLCFG